MRIPMAALRRALSEMAQGGRAVFRDTGLPGVPLGNAAVGGVAGGIIGEGGNPYDDTDGGHGVEGALIGAALGGGVGLAGGLGRAAGNLREALAARAAERGMGRAVSRVAGDVDDAARFDAASHSPAQRYNRTRDLHNAARWAEENGVDTSAMNADELLDAYFAQRPASGTFGMGGPGMGY